MRGLHGVVPKNNVILASLKIEPALIVVTSQVSRFEIALF